MRSWLIAFFAAVFTSSSQAAVIGFSLFVEGNTAGNPVSSPPDSGNQAGNQNPAPFVLTNLSATESLTSFTLDLTGTGTLFDPITGGPFPNGNGVPFFVANNSAALDGITVDTVSVVDGGPTLTLTFSGFDPGDTLAFLIDIDSFPGNIAVQGDELIGALASSSFASGVASGLLEAVPGNNDASQVVAFIPEPSSAVLIGLGCAAVVGQRRRRRARG